MDWLPSPHILAGAGIKPVIQICTLDSATSARAHAGHLFEKRSQETMQREWDNEISKERKPISI